MYVVYAPKLPETIIFFVEDMLMQLIRAELEIFISEITFDTKIHNLPSNPYAMRNTLLSG